MSGIVLTVMLSGTASAAEPHHVLDPAGPQAAHIAGLWHLMLWVCGIVFVAVLAAVGWALWRAPRVHRGERERAAPASPRARRGAAGGVWVATGASTLALAFLIVASIVTDTALAKLSLRDALHVELTANQWWWEARYDDTVASRIFTTANELHLPVGRPVVLTLRSNDVIHSFWVPALHGKKDLIPGRTTKLALEVSEPGTYRGQCAEFCGLQHARMAVLVVAQSPADYEAWAAQQRAAAAPPADALAQRGRELFLSTTCAMCHTVQGTSAGGRRGPDLTHVAQRRLLAAGALHNGPEAMQRWIRDPQRIKPGTTMPASDLGDDDVHAIVAYLQGLY